MARPDAPTRPWWQTGVIYQIYPRSFMDRTGDGIGNLGGIIDRLDYFADTLPVDALWLSPFYPSPMADFGYDVADYTDVDPRFGTLADFDQLVAEVHRRGLKLIVDFVPNHSSDQHPWFVASRSSRQSPKRDWYVWQDPAPGGGPPNNWLSVFGGSAWELDEVTGQYYLHSFLKEQPDLNWRNPDVERAMTDALGFWMDRGVDGFRVDVAHFVMKDPELRDNPRNSNAASNMHKSHGPYDELLHIYSNAHPDVHAVYRRLRRFVDGYDPDRERVMIGEIHEFDLAKWARYYGEGLDEFHMPFNFSLLKTPWTAAGVWQAVETLEAAIPDGAWPNYVLGNHDEQRLATRLGGEPQARLAAMLLLTLRGTPTLYYGDELGMREATIPPERQQDPWGLRVPGLGRDGCRTPMPWREGPAMGFSEAAPEALWLPAGDGRPGISVAEQQGDPTSVLSLYRTLLDVRHASPALQAGSYAAVEAPPAVFAFSRAHGDEVVVVALNFSENTHTAEVPGGVLLASTHPGREELALGGTLELAPWEGVAVRVG